MKTTRSRQREQEKKNQESEPSESMSIDQSISNVLPTVSVIEQCPICLENLTTQEVGIPENCEHSFCLDCIIRWAKVIKTNEIKLLINEVLFFFLGK